MIIDSRAEFCDAAALDTGAAGAYPSIGKLYDLIQGGLAVYGINAIKALPGNSDSCYFVASVQTTCTSGGSATLQLRLMSDAQDPMVAASATEHYKSPTFAVADLVAGKQLCCIELPRGDYERYLGVVQDTGTAAFTAGKIDAYLTFDPPARDIVADALA